MGGTLRLATIDDAPQIAAIYEHFVLNTPISFESDPPNVAETARRISSTLEQYPFLVCDQDGVIAAYAYATQHRVRFHYQWSVDVSVYVHEAFRRQGIATALYTALLKMLPLQGYYSAFAGITLPNPGSVGLHESLGFTPVGIYRNVGFKLGSWHNVGWWQRPLAEPKTSPGTPLPLSAVTNSEQWKQCLVAKPDTRRTPKPVALDAYAASTVEAFKVCRDEIKHEYGVLANRLNSYMTSQAFLVSGYAISMGNMTATGRDFRLWFPIFLSLVGVTLTIRAHPGISGVCHVIQRWHERQEELFDRGVGLDDFGVLRRDSVKAIHDNNLVFAQTSTIIFGVAWLIMAGIAIAVH